MSRFYKNLQVFFLVALGIYLFDQTRMWLSGNYMRLGFVDELIRFLYYFMYSFVIGSANIAFIKQLDRFVSWDNEPKKRAILGFLGALIVSLLSLFLLRLFILTVIKQKNWQAISGESVRFYIFSLFISFVVILIFYVIHFYRALAKKSITEQQSIAQGERAKYESLKSQLDPHFLFNSLNVLTALIEENPEKAEVFTTKLSKVYRYVLEQKEKNLVPLQEELQFAKTFMELMYMRFEGAIHFELPDKLMGINGNIVPLSLQLVLENAIKHNQISKEKPLHISLKLQDKSLLISNNNNPKKILQKGTGIGLKNIVQRYALLTDRAVDINTSEKHFSVRLPILTKPSKNMKTSRFSPKESYDNALKKVAAIKSFYGNLFSYVIIIAFLAYVNYRNDWSHKWFLYPMIGWGIGLLFHYFNAFDKHPFFNKNWEKKQVEKIMHQENRERWE